ncbi:MAG: hypothetical protein AB1758_01945 [Candidatus Eremiobacterota bacterium]
MQIERIAALQSRMQAIQWLADGSGRGLDPGIIDLVVGLQVNGFQTDQSCEGHTDRAHGAPWVSIDVSNEGPRLAPGSSRPIVFENQREIFEEVAERHGLTLADLAAPEAWKRAQEQPYAPEEVRRQESLAAARTALGSLLQEFGQGHFWLDVAPAGNFWLISGTPEDYRRTAIPPGHEQRLAVAREQAREFGLYLQERFLDGGPALGGAAGVA